jgi:type IV pilus assembly protein PilE
MRQTVSPRRRTGAGFSLIELMITVGILTILASIAFPSYRTYVLRSNRGDATQALLRIAAQQEKYFLQNNIYAATMDDLGVDTKSEHGWYDLDITAGDVNGFTAQAVADPDESQAGDDACQTFSIDAQGRKLALDSGGGANEDTCWH